MITVKLGTGLAGVQLAALMKQVGDEMLREGKTACLITIEWPTGLTRRFNLQLLDDEPRDPRSAAMIDFLNCDMRGCHEQNHLLLCFVCQALICPAHRSVVSGEITCHACAPQKPAAPDQGEMFSQGRGKR